MFAIVIKFVPNSPTVQRAYGEAPNIHLMIIITISCCMHGVSILRVGFSARGYTDITIQTFIHDTVICMVAVGTCSAVVVVGDGNCYCCCANSLTH